MNACNIFNGYNKILLLKINRFLHLFKVYSMQINIGIRCMSMYSGVRRVVYKCSDLEEGNLRLSPQRLNAALDFFHRIVRGVSHEKRKIKLSMYMSYQNLTDLRV